MSLWGAVPLHPRVRRTQGSEVAAGRAEEGPAEGVGWRPGGLGTVRKGSQRVTREPSGVWGCEESPEDCSHASQLRQQRLQLQPLSPSGQTGRSPFPPFSRLILLGGNSKRDRLPCPAQVAEERGTGWWQEQSVRLETRYLPSSGACWQRPYSFCPFCPSPLSSSSSDGAHGLRLTWMPTP